MKALVVYESMFGNTRKIAASIADGLGSEYQVEVRPVAWLAPGDTEGIDLLVVGGPTHVHSMSRPSTRLTAADKQDAPGSTVRVEVGATESGIREWLESLSPFRCLSAAFDTRVDGPAIVTGRASKRVDKELHRLGAIRLAEPESFLVNRQDELVVGELERARAWGETLATTAVHAVAPD